VVDLRTELQAARQQAGEAIAQQAAVSDVLRAMIRSPSTLDEVLQATIDHGTTLCQAENGLIYLLSGDELRLRTDSRASPEATAYELAHPTPIDRGSAVGRAVVERNTVHITDVLADPEYRWLETQQLVGYRTLLAVPIRRANEVLGVIAFSRGAVLPFSERDIALVETFADQAAIAIENVRLFNETKEALERQTATSDILKVIASSPANVQPVLDAIAQSAARVCGASDAHVYRVDGDLLRQWAHYGPIPGLEPDESLPLNGGSLIGRSIVDRRAIHTRDAATDLDPNEYPISVQLQRRWGYRTSLAVPLLREGVAIGGIAIRRMEVRPFTPTQIELLRTFADQAVIAIENVRLFNETTEALERQTALAEILRVISRSPTDVQPVLEAIVENALRFCAAEDAAVMLPNGDQLGLAAHRGSVPVANDLRYPNDGTSVSSRAFLQARTIAVQDLQTAIDFPLGAENARSGGYHATVGAPLLHAGAAVGVIVLRRFDARPFSEREIGALETFAAQAVIAIENVRLFNETNEALERQTATSEVLKVISTSTSEVQPVFEAVVRKANDLCDAERSLLWLRRDDGFRLAAGYGIGEQFLASQRDRVEVVGRGSIVGRTALEGRPIHLADILADPDYIYPEDQRLSGFRTVLGVPIRREHEIIGVIALDRNEVRPFSDTQIRLVQTFADQAAIAIENVRLFNETKESLERQTAVADVLSTTLASGGELRPVLDAVVQRATQLCGADVAYIYRVEGPEAYRMVAMHGAEPNTKELLPFFNTTVRGATIGRALIDRATVHIPDIEKDAEYEEEFGTQRTQLAVPLMRGGVPIGVLGLWRYQARPFTADQIRLVETFADQAAIAIENVRLFNEIQDKSKALAAASRHKSEFLANMSHELRTPLNAIIGFSDVLEQRLFGELNARQADYTRDIASSGRHLLDLVNEILDLSKVEAGRMELEPSEFALAETIHGTLAFIRERAVSHRIALTADVPIDLGTLVADERKVRQVLLNLLSNAVKFTPDGGTIDVRARRGNGEVEVAVRDTGIGIAPEDQAKVFDEFQQVGRPSDRSREGTGLGLTLAKRFIELHRGRIWIESEVGTGTTFTFAIPVATSAAAPA
jgi:GAF domain-containing protein/anti-sigma regulatory factor (Ser/Thr protein kinase)